MQEFFPHNSEFKSRNVESFKQVPDAFFEDSAPPLDKIIQCVTIIFLSLSFAFNVTRIAGRDDSI